MRSLRMNISFLSRLGLVPLGLIAWIGLSSTATAAAPANDNFANAITISGFWGTTNADTTAATAEPGEPAHAGAAAAHSVWFKLIAIQDGTMTIHTFGSAIDTRLAVYAVPANTNAAVNGSLFPVAANDDFDLRQDQTLGPLLGPNGPAVTAGPSAFHFPVKQGGARSAPQTRRDPARLGYLPYHRLPGQYRWRPSGSQLSRRLARHLLRQLALHRLPRRQPASPGGDCQNRRSLRGLQVRRRPEGFHHRQRYPPGVARYRPRLAAPPLRRPRQQRPRGAEGAQPRGDCL